MMPFKNAWFLPQTTTRISDVCLSCVQVQGKQQQLDEFHFTGEFGWKAKATEYDYINGIMQKGDPF